MGIADSINLFWNEATLKGVWKSIRSGVSKDGDIRESIGDVNETVKVANETELDNTNVLDIEDENYYRLQVKTS